MGRVVVLECCVRSTWIRKKRLPCRSAVILDVRALRQVLDTTYFYRDTSSVKDSEVCLLLNKRCRAFNSIKRHNYELFHDMLLYKFNYTYVNTKIIPF